MSGFTLGDAGGATLGQSTGGLLGTPQTTYLIDGQQAGTLQSEVATDRLVTLSVRVTTARLRDILRPLKSNQGKVDVLEADDGGFTALDRANGNNSFTLDPPDDRQPLRQSGTVHVRRYEEQLVSQAIDEWDVELELVRDANRTDTPHVPSVEEQVTERSTNAGFILGGAGGATLGGDAGGTLAGSNGTEKPTTWWAFATRFGDLYTERVDAEFLGRGADGVERFELTARFTFDQAHVFEAAFNRLAGVRIRNVVETDNIAVDETAGDDMTVTIDSPTPDTVADGDYVVLSWQSERVNDAFQEVTFEIAKAG